MTCYAAPVLESAVLSLLSIVDVEDPLGAIAAIPDDHVIQPHPEIVLGESAEWDGTPILRWRALAPGTGLIEIRTDPDEPGRRFGGVAFTCGYLIRTNDDRWAIFGVDATADMLEEAWGMLYELNRL